MVQMLVYVVLLWCAHAKPEAKQKPERMAPLVTVDHDSLKDEEYKCARCRYSAMMIRLHLSKLNLKKAPKDAAVRRGLVQKALAEGDNDNLEDVSACARQKFPKEIKESIHRKTKRINYADVEQSETRNIFFRKIESGMKGVIDKVAEACKAITAAVKEVAAQRAFDFTEKVEKFTVGRAFTDRWTCYRATGICLNIDFPELDEDEDEDDDSVVDEDL